MEKEVLIKIKVNLEKDEFGNLITVKGFDNGKPIMNTIELIGLLDVVKQQEINKLFRKETKGS